MIGQIFNPTGELVMPTGTPTNEPNVKIQIHPLTAEMKKRKSSN